MEDKTQELVEKLLENQDTIEKILEKIILLEKTGALDTLADLAAFVKVAQDTLSDEIIKKNSELITNLGLVSAKFTSDNALMLIDAIGDAICRCDKEPEPVGLTGLLKAMNDPDVKFALGFLINMAKALGRALRERA
ncbi:DUF1641 domain-containing protein [Geoglobus acetivorans]|uniref:DUF1641 domain-containing protein n=1 Tax=Geoglobus acetivorans TaxID=565033 RepID=A0ABZ3H1C4_GEOAI|nr:DUF1641 domain-containing protein [Geoglobus acetivorans]